MAAPSAPSVPGGGPVTSSAEPDRRRWLILALIGLAQLMIVLDITIMNIALPSAQHALGFSNVDRQWIITAYALSFGSLLLFGGRLGDLFGRKVTLLTGLLGFAAASAVGGASINFTMLVTARACQGVFAALLAPAALSLLTTTFSDPKERGKAFGVYGAIVGSGGLIGLLLGGLLTEYLDWRWCLYVNLIFAAVAVAGALILLTNQRAAQTPRLDYFGVVTVSGSMFCLVYGFSNAATHSWSAASTWGWLAAGVVLLAVFVAWQFRVQYPLLPPRVVLDRNRGGAYLAVLVIGAGMFGIFLFLTYYLQTILGYSPLKTGVAFLPTIVRGRHRPVHAVLDEHRDVRGRAVGRGCRLGHAERRAAAGRLDRDRVAQHHRHQRGRNLPDQPAPQPGRAGHGPGQAGPGHGPGPRLHHRVLVDGRDLRRGWRGLWCADAVGAAVQASRRYRQRPGRSARGWPVCPGLNIGPLVLA
jgi:MFS family permease